MTDLLLEIGTEELPAGYIAPALQWLATQLPAALKDARLEHGAARVDGTPRRLVVVVEGVAARQPDVSGEVTGPPAERAWDADGKLTKAGAGFLRGKGAEESAAFRKQTKKGEVMAVKVHEEGRPAAEVLSGVLGELIGRVPFKKTMRWSDGKQRFGRPVRWLLALLGDEVVKVEFGDVRSGSSTHGHRFHAPDAVTVSSVAGYEAALKDARVMLSIEERQTRIRDEATRLAKEVGGEWLADEELLEEVANLVEYPFPVLGRFDERFLEMPRELLLSEMKEHQRYFGVTQADGTLMNAFIVVAGSEPPDAEKLAAGNKRVLHSRFDDGAFYFKEDAKLRLDERTAGLKRVVFQRDLGTLADKVARVVAITTALADEVGASADEKASAVRAAELCKADLVSGVVGEFPELQGTMGRYYALRDGEDEAVAWAIEQHYWPRSSKAGLPDAVPGALVGVADRLDTLAGILGVGKAPKGSADPFGLRRAAIAVERIVLAMGWHVPLPRLVEIAVTTLGDKSKQPADVLGADLTGFLEARFKNVLRDRCVEEGFTGVEDIVDAAMGAGTDDLVDAEARCLALAGFRSRDVVGFPKLAATFKRVGNILAKARADGAVPSAKKMNDKALVEAAEKGLFSEVTRARESFAARKEGEGGLAARYASTLKAIVGLKPAVDLFFEDVMVMAEDPDLRAARLDLLAGVEEMLVTVADVTKIQAD